MPTAAVTKRVQSHPATTDAAAAAAVAGPRSRYTLDSVSDQRAVYKNVHIKATLRRPLKCKLNIRK